MELCGFYPGYPGYPGRRFATRSQARSERSTTLLPPPTFVTLTHDALTHFAAFLALFCAPNAFSAEEISGPVIGIDLGMFAKCNEP